MIIQHYENRRRQTIRNVRRQPQTPAVGYISFLEALEEIEVPTTSKIAEQVGCSYDLAYRRLHELEDRGDVTKQDVGGSFIWKAVSEQ